MAAPGVSCSLIRHPAVDESKVALSLLSDLSVMLPPDVTLDFMVEGLELGEETGSILVLVDDTMWAKQQSSKVELKGLAKGYHLLRAFLLDGPTDLVLKSPLAYIEAEFTVVQPSPPMKRVFLFGQPSLCFLPFRVDAAKTDELRSLVCDFFVHNCEVGGGPAGFSVRVYVNDVKVDSVREWAAFTINGAAAVDGKVVVRLALVNPAGEELLYPSYNCVDHSIKLVYGK